MSDTVGRLTDVNEFIVHAALDGRLILGEQVWVGKDRLTAEVITVSPRMATMQVYEETGGLQPGAPVYGSGRPLSLLLGPGLIGSTFDGLQRPLYVLRDESGIFLGRSTEAKPLDPQRQWAFEPRVAEGDEVAPGAVLGVVEETPLVEHRILVPPTVRGRVNSIAEAGDYTIDDEIASVESEDGQTHSLQMVQQWPVRRARPRAENLPPVKPLVTGQRVLDTFFPVAKGGTAAVPGPFGAGKTVLQHSLAKWSDADIIVYVGCGERGNEMAEVLEDFPELEDPRSGHPLMERTILIANTSNMPVAAREASIYTGVTIAEYYRDQGYDVALMADSTSRWAEALREISGRLEEMPAEEGFPAYLPSRLAAFYERAGRVRTLGGAKGSLTLIGAVSPPGGDFSEPVTRNTQRFTRAWWALSRELANARHYPAVDWLQSYSLYLDEIAGWWNERVEQDWQHLRQQASNILQRENDLQQLVNLVGPEALAPRQRWVLQSARLLREGFLQQNAYHEIDAFASPEKQAALLALFVAIFRRGQSLLEGGVPLERIRRVLDMPRLIRLKNEVPNDEPDRIHQIQDEVLEELNSLTQ